MSETIEAKLPDGTVVWCKYGAICGTRKALEAAQQAIAAALQPQPRQWRDWDVVELERGSRLVRLSFLDPEYPWRKMPDVLDSLAHADRELALPCAIYRGNLADLLAQREAGTAKPKSDPSRWRAGDVLQNGTDFAVRDASGKWHWIMADRECATNDVAVEKVLQSGLGAYRYAGNLADLLAQGPIAAGFTEAEAQRVVEHLGVHSGGGRLRIDRNGFMECAECSAKPGSPPLCPSCAQNRETIERLTAQVREQETPEPRQWRDGDVASARNVGYAIFLNGNFYWLARGWKSNIGPEEDWFVFTGINLADLLAQGPIAAGLTEAEAQRVVEHLGVHSGGDSLHVVQKIRAALAAYRNTIQGDKP